MLCRILCKQTEQEAYTRNTFSSFNHIFGPDARVFKDASKPLSPSLQINRIKLRVNMPPVYIDSPRTEISDTSRLSSIHELDFSIEPSFHSPAKRNNGLVAQARSNKTTSITNKTLAASALRTPNIRTALNDRRNPPAKAEFTPLLKSATKNRKSQRDAVLLQPRDGGLETPAALKPNYNFDTPRLPELSMVNDSSSLSIGNDQSTPMAPAVSSSVMSTPLPEIQAEGGAALDGGNILTLREQEVVRTRLIFGDKDDH